MPTGYTQFIESGAITTGKDFLKLCLRNFGVFMRFCDDPFRPDLPTRKFEVNPFYTQHVAEASAKLAELSTMTDDNWQSRYEKDLADFKKRLQDDIDNAAKNTAAYNKIRVEIESIELSDVYKNLKDFALQQIDESVKFVGPSRYYEADYEKLKNMSLEDYKKEVLYQAQEDVRYYTARLEEEQNAVESHQKFLDCFLKEIDDFQEY